MLRCEHHLGRRVERRATHGLTQDRDHIRTGACGRADFRRKRGASAAGHCKKWLEPNFYIRQPCHVQDPDQRAGELFEEKWLNRCAMSKVFVILFCSTAFAGRLVAQLDLMTFREAESIVERVPDVVAARKEGRSTLLSGAYDGEADEVSFWVRGGCGPTRGQLIENYKVNRWTGTVTLWGDNPLPVADEEGKLFAERLMLQVHSRILSADEAKCLALEAAKALPGWRSNG